jgi:hypothetical protein
MNEKDTKHMLALLALVAYSLVTLAVTFLMVVVKYLNP